MLPVVNEKGEIVESATRQQCHAGTKLLHPVVHLHVFNSSGMLYLQRRSWRKDIQPGKWDTSVGGHVDYGEAINDAVRREAKEELGLENANPQLLYSYIFESEIERELVNTYWCMATDESIRIDPVEIEEGRFFSFKEIEDMVGTGSLTANFELEFKRLRKFLSSLNFSRLQMVIRKNNLEKSPWT